MRNARISAGEGRLCGDLRLLTEDFLQEDFRFKTLDWKLFKSPLDSQKPEVEWVAMWFRRWPSICRTGPIDFRDGQFEEHQRKVSRIASIQFGIRFRRFHKSNSEFGGSWMQFADAFSDGVFKWCFQMLLSNAAFGCFLLMPFSDAVCRWGFQTRFSDAIRRFNSKIQLAVHNVDQAGSGESNCKTF